MSDRLVDYMTKLERAQRPVRVSRTDRLRDQRAERFFRKSIAAEPHQQQQQQQQAPKET